MQLHVCLLLLVISVQDPSSWVTAMEGNLSGEVQLDDGSGSTTAGQQPDSPTTLGWTILSLPEEAVNNRAETSGPSDRPASASTDCLHTVDTHTDLLNTHSVGTHTDQIKSQTQPLPLTTSEVVTVSPALRRTNTGFPFTFDSITSSPDNRIPSSFGPQTMSSVQNFTMLSSVILVSQSGSPDPTHPIPSQKPPWTKTSTQHIDSHVSSSSESSKTTIDSTTTVVTLLLTHTEEKQTHKEDIQTRMDETLTQTEETPSHTLTHTEDTRTPSEETWTHTEDNQTQTQTHREGIQTHMDETLEHTQTHSQDIRTHTSTHTEETPIRDTQGHTEQTKKHTWTHTLENLTHKEEAHISSEDTRTPSLTITEATPTHTWTPTQDTATHKEESRTPSENTWTIKEPTPTHTWTPTQDTATHKEETRTPSENTWTMKEATPTHTWTTTEDPLKRKEEIHTRIEETQTHTRRHTTTPSIFPHVSSQSPQVSSPKRGSDPMFSTTSVPEIPLTLSSSSGRLLSTFNPREHQETLSWSSTVSGPHLSVNSLPAAVPKFFIVPDQPASIRVKTVELLLQMMVEDSKAASPAGLQEDTSVWVTPYLHRAAGFSRVLDVWSSGQAVQSLLEFHTSGALRWIGTRGSLLELTGLASVVHDGTRFRKSRITNITVGGVQSDVCDWLLQCPAGFNCQSESGNFSCSSVCHTDHCRHQGLCTHHTHLLPVCRCLVGEDFWFMGRRCDVRMTRGRLVGTCVAVVLLVVAVIGALALVAVRRYRAALIQAKVDQTRSSYRRFNHFDELSGRFWPRPSAGSADSLDNPAFTPSDELLHLRALDRPCCYHDDTMSLPSTCPSHINTVYPHSSQYGWWASEASIGDGVLDSGKASDLSVCSWPVEPIHWTPFPLLQQLAVQRTPTVCVSRTRSYCEGMELVDLSKSWTA